MASSMASVGFVSKILKKTSAATSEQQERLIRDLNNRALKVEDELKELVLQNYQEFNYYYTGLQELSQQITRLESDHAKIAQGIEEDTVVKLLESAGKRQEITKKLSETNQLINVVSSIECICKALDRFEKHFKEGSLFEAAQELSKTRGSIETLNNIIPTARILATLRSEVAESTADLHLRLAKETGKVFAWSECATSPATPDDALSVFLITASAEFDSTSLFNALSVSSKLPGHAKSLAALVASRLVASLIRWPQLKLVLRPAAENKSTLLLSETESPPEFQSARHFLSVLKDLVLVLKHIGGVVSSAQSPAWMQAMGSVLFPKLTTDLKEKLLVPLLPSLYAEQEDFHKVEVAVGGFEGALSGLGLVPGGDSGSELGRFVAGAEQHLSEKLSQDLLSRGRELLKRPLLTTTEASLVRCGAETVGSTPKDADKEGLESLEDGFPPCLISSAVGKFALLVKEVLSSEDLPEVQCVVCARFLVELFLAVMPAQHRALIGQNTRAAIVYHNSHLYLADCLATISVWAKMPSEASTCSLTRSFVHFIPLLRYNGEKAFLQAMTREKDSILECLKRARGVTSSADDERKALLSKSLQQVLKFVGDFRVLAEGALPPYLLGKSAGGLLDVLALWLADGIVALADVSAREAEVLGGFVQFVGSQGARAAGLSAEEASRLCLHWGRLKQVGMVLQSNLQEITAFWSASAAADRHLKAIEVRSMIRALFQNTDRRAQALSSIK